MIVDVYAIRRELNTRGLFLRELSEAAGISYASLYKTLKTGKCGLKVARGIAGALNMETDDLILNYSRGTSA